MKALLFIFTITLLLFTSCGKKHQGAAVAIKFSASNLVASGDYPGGIQLYGRRNLNQDFFAYNLTNKSNFEIILSTGEWEFLAIGWDGDATVPMSGDTYCAESGPVKVDLENVVVNLKLTKNGCNKDDFAIAPSGVVAGSNNLENLKVYVCNAFIPDVSYSFSYSNGESVSGGFSDLSLLTVGLPDGRLCLKKNEDPLKYSASLIERVSWGSNPLEEEFSRGLRTKLDTSGTSNSRFPIGEVPLPNDVGFSAFPAVIAVYQNEESADRPGLEKANDFFVFTKGIVNGPVNLDRAAYKAASNILFLKFNNNIRELALENSEVEISTPYSAVDVEVNKFTNNTGADISISKCSFVTSD